MTNLERLQQRADAGNPHALTLLLAERLALAFPFDSRAQAHVRVCREEYVRSLAREKAVDDFERDLGNLPDLYDSVG